jgi:hypothetical protein
MRTQTLLSTTTADTSNVTGDSFKTYPDHYELTKGVNVATSGVCTFVINDQNATATLQGSIDGTNFVTVKATSRSGSNIAEGYTVAIFPFMRVALTGVTAASVVKVDIAYA